MRVVGIGVIGCCVVLAALGLVVACSSSDDGGGATTTPEGGATDAPTGPRVDGGADVVAPVSGDLQHSGTRIKLQGTQTADGSFYFSNYYDSMLMAACSPRMLPDGHEYCVPDSSPGGVQYSDDQCTTLVTAVSIDSCAPKFVVAEAPTSNPCAPALMLYRAGAKTAPTMVYQKNGATCTGFPADARQSYYAIGAVVASSELVALTSAEVAVGSALKAYVYDGADGSRLLRNKLLDVQRNKPCEVKLADDLTVRCTPSASVRTQAYSDMGCANRAADPAFCTVPDDVFDDTVASRVEPGATCDPKPTHFFQVGAKRTTRDEWRNDDDAGCMGPFPSMRDVYDVGAEIAASTFPAITIGRAGGAYVGEQTYLSSGTTISHGGQLIDGLTNSPCEFGNAGDGRLRCLPRAVGASYFSDPGCSMPIGVTSDACEAATARHVSVTTTTACVRSTHIYLIGTKLDPLTTTAYTGTPGDCNQVAGTSAIAYYTIGEEVNVASFPVGTTVTK